MRELYPRLLGLALRARRWDVGLNIDAEESERLDLSLDMLEALCREPGLKGWNGVGFVVQAYQETRLSGARMDHRTRARSTNRRIMLRLVEGRLLGQRDQALRQVDGLEGFRGVHPQDPHRRFLYRHLHAKLLTVGGSLTAVFPQWSPPTTR